MICITYVYVKCIAKLTMYFISSNVGPIFYFYKDFFLHFRLSSITTNPMEMMTRLKKINCQNCKRTIFFQHMKVWKHTLQLALHHLLYFGQTFPKMRKKLSQLTKHEVQWVGNFRVFMTFFNWVFIMQ